MHVIKTFFLQGQFLGVEHLIFLVNTSLFPEFLVSGGMFQILGPNFSDHY